MKYSSEAKVDEKTVAQRKAFESALNKQWDNATKIIKEIKDKESDRKTKGYLCQILAEYTNKTDKILAQQILLSGRNWSAAILSPIEGIQYQRTKNNLPQAQAISTFAQKESENANELLMHVDSILSNLSMGIDYNMFEDILNQVGEALGFVCSRPDKETNGDGPDNLWAVDSNTFFVIECKDEAVANTISKAYCNQLSGSVNWFRENYVYPNECIPFMIHPSKVVDKAASPNENMLVMTKHELELFRKNVRNFYAELCRNDNYKDVGKINELLKLFKLKKEDIPNEYAVKFERRN